MTYNFFDVDHMDDVTVVRLAGGQLDSRRSIDHFRDELKSLIDEQQPEKLVLNFGRVSHATSQVVGALIDLCADVNLTQGEMKLCEMHPGLRNTFNVLDAERTLFPIHDCENEACQEFERREN